VIFLRLLPCSDDAASQTDSQLCLYCLFVDLLFNLYELVSADKGTGGGYIAAAGQGVQMVRLRMMVFMVGAWLISI
jgi:hypothetical protein